MPLHISNYEPSSELLWSGRNDNFPNERFYQITQCIDIRQQPMQPYAAPYVLAGLCSDEGILRNGGRPGARSGPLSFREQFSKLAVHNDLSILDVGNVSCIDGDLENAQAEFGKLIAHCQEHNKITIGIGGGHEIAWAHYQGLHSQHQRLGIINFDAHFDLRQVNEHALGTSGTPFKQIADYSLVHNRSFNYCCIGIQQHANTGALYETAHDLGVSVLSADELNESSFAWQTAFIDQFMLNQKAIYLSICLDVFAECLAPGVSAPQPTGLTSRQVIPLLKYIMQTGKVVAIDIAELSPPLDHANMTARLAAVLLAELLNFN